MEKNHILKILYLLINVLVKNGILLIVCFKSLYDGLGLYKAGLIILVGMVVILGICILSWYKTVFCLKEDTIYYQSGLLNVKKREIPFARVNTMDLSQGMIDKLFNVAKIKIDTGSTQNNGSEISLFLNRDRATVIKDSILNRGNEPITEYEEEKVVHYQLSFKDLMIYSLTSNGILSGIGIIMIVYNFLDDYVTEVLQIDFANHLKFSAGNQLYKIIILISTVIILSICLSFFYSLIKYHHFEVFTAKDQLNVSYGLFNKKSYCFDIKKIKGIHSKQNLIMQLLNIRTLEMESIGYGDEKGEKAILYPICSKAFQNELVSQLLPEFVFEDTIHPSPPVALPRFIVKKLIFVAITAGLLTYYFQYGYISILLLPFVLGLGYFQHKNTALGMNDDLVYMSYNGFYRNQSIIKITAVQAFAVSDTFFQKRKGVCDFTIHIFSSEFGKSIKVSNVDKRVVEDYLLAVK